MDNLPVVIANVQELDALWRAWLEYDIAVVERMEVEREYLLAELGRMTSLADEYRSERDAARAVVEAARELMAMPLPERLKTDITWGSMERQKIALVSSHEFQRRLVLLAEAVAAYEQPGE